MKSEILARIESGIKKYCVAAILIAGAIFLCGSLWTFSSTDQSWFYYSNSYGVNQNMFGLTGSYAASLFLYLFGRASLTFVALFLYGIYAYVTLFVTKTNFWIFEWDRAVGAVIGFFAVVMLADVSLVSIYDFTYAGGIVGKFLVEHLLASFDVLVQKIILGTTLLASSILVTRCSYLPLVYYCCDRKKMPAYLFIQMIKMSSFLIMAVVNLVIKIIDLLRGMRIRTIDSSIVEFEREEAVDKKIDAVVQDLFWNDYLDKNAKTFAATKDVDSVHNAMQEDHNFIEEGIKSSIDQKDPLAPFQAMKTKDEIPALTGEENFEKPKKIIYQLPVVQVKQVEQKVLVEKQEMLAQQAKLLEEKLEQFDIKGSVVGMHAGPVVTLFEYQPDIKVKVSRILALEDDLAMALQALSIRIIAPIPGRSVVGFEVANRQRQDVFMSKILATSDFKNFQGSLPLIFGQDTLGNDIIADLAKMPHLLLAGSTGSGKSVALNVMLTSLLCALSPDQLKLIIIDPKRLEFAAYDGIAHLLFPIITETKKAIPILKWVVQSMEERYEIMAKHGVRNLLEYQTAAKQNKEMPHMPLMVVIIDELADLMMTAGKAVEDSIARIAQMARAAGIHMIIATQRPSVDVITGMIKVNFPNRVAFKVTSKIDSRTILDAAGAEKLLGRGDMLFLDATKSHLVRVHGAYISDKEIHDIVYQIKAQRKVEYLDLFEQLADQHENELFDGDDELYQEVVEFLDDLDEVSISMLQRRFRIGYNRSARIISILESKGLIISVEGGKTRRVVK
jgi:hypothetical protein